MREPIVIYENEEYEVKQLGNVYTISYFDEHTDDYRYNRNKKKKQSIVTKSYDYVKNFLK